MSFGNTVVSRERGIKETMKGSMSVEWTTKQPANNKGPITGPDFTVEGTRCFLQFFYNYGREYDLSLHVCDPLQSPFHVKTHLSVGVDLFLSKTKDGVQADNDYIIWKSNRPELAKIVPDFQPYNGVWCFKIEFCKVHLEDKSVQTPVYSDANFEIQHLSEDLSHLLDQDSSSDVRLKCGGVIFKAHRSLLSVRSEVFGAMLGSDMTEARTGQVQIDDVDADLFRQFLRYLYTGRLEELTMDIAMRLYELADKYSVQALMEQCASFLVENLRRDNACAVLSLAERHSDGQLKEDATAFILNQKIPFQEDEPNWSDFTVRHPALAIEVLTRLCKSQAPSKSDV